MTRTKQREQAFLLVFESLFCELDPHELIEASENIIDDKICNYAKKVLTGIFDNKEKIDELIDKNTKAWKKERISKSALSILKVAIYEILFEENIPNSVSINEAVELAKIYGTDNDPSFINGILATIVKSEV